MRSRKLLRFVSLFALLCASACGPSGNTDTDAGDVVSSDASDSSAEAAVDAEPLPPGPRGRVLSVPQTPGEDWVLTGLTAPAYVLRTEAGIPHIYAANDRDAAMVQGFVTARDRYFQLELSRRLGQGLLSPLLGERGLPTDQSSRDRGYTFVAERILNLLTPEQTAIFDAYVRGINAYIDAVKTRRITQLPTELPAVGLLLGTTRSTDLMQPMTRRDLAAILSVVLFNSSHTEDDLVRARAAATLPTMFRGAASEELRRAGAREIFDRVAPITDVTSAAGFGLERMAANAPRNQRRTRTRTAAPHVPNQVLDQALEAGRRLAMVRRLVRDGDAGSNAWATAGRANANGAAILSGDGHLPLSVPTLLHQAGVDTQVFGDATTGSNLLGLFFPGIPMLALGTNGHVAYSFTYLYGDLTDWYAEEVQLDAQGRPQASRFRGEWRPLMPTQERYEVADVPALMSRGRTEMSTRWTTFDGRWIASVEGRPPTPGQTPPAGQSIITVAGVQIIPQDTDGDGKISAVSFDYTGFDVNNVLLGLQTFQRARNVMEMREAQRRFVAFAQNFISADDTGHVHYSGYTATPCRSYLEKQDARWVTGADPRLLLDGTRYGGFTIPVNAQGLPDETAGASDPQRCVIPFDDWPSAMDPARGFVLTANNDLGGTSRDNNLANDRHYLGGPWDVGYRARTIRDTLARHTMNRSSTIEANAALQADHRSNLVAELLPFLREAIAAGRAAATGAMPMAGTTEARMRDAYISEREAIDEAERRIDAWVMRGANAASGVATFYDTPTSNDRDDAVATMLFNAWYRATQQGVFGDETGMAALFDTDPRFLRITALLSVLRGRGDGNPMMQASWNPATRESAFFDVLGTPEVETSKEVLLAALVRALRGLREAPTAPGVGGFGTRDMSQYLWGLRHQVVLESIINAFAQGVSGVEVITNRLKIAPSRIPLADNLAMGDPRRDAPWFPRPGDYFAVDASNPSDVGPDFFYRNGPVMRMVIELRNGTVRGQNVLPAGQSGVASSPNFDDQARLWLGNRAVPMRYDVESVVAGATGRETFRP